MTAIQELILKLEGTEAALSVAVEALCEIEEVDSGCDANYLAQVARKEISIALGDL